MLASQRRLFLHGALTQGSHASWDYPVRKDGWKQYVRSVSITSTTATKAKERFRVPKSLWRRTSPLRR